MKSLSFSPSLILYSFVIGILISIALIIAHTYDTSTTVVFCDVGQGDSAYVRLPGNMDILIDTGKGRDVLMCLGKHMPFFDRRIEMVFVSHPQQDHCGSLEVIMERYNVDTVFIPPVDNTAEFFSSLKEKMENDTEVVFPTSNDIIRIRDNVEITFYWPTSEYINDYVTFSESQDFGSTSTDVNDFSLIFSLKIDDRVILFTGDASNGIINRVSQTINKRTDILKVPHHGASNGLTGSLLSTTKPEFAVISVGKKNAYGHPSLDIISLLEQTDIKPLRTDEEGDIVFKIHDGNISSRFK